MLKSEDLNADIDKMIEDCVFEKMALIPDKTKFVGSTAGWSDIGQLPEILHVTQKTSFRPLSRAERDFLSLLGDILNKRWRTLDLISMMEEVNRDLLMKEITADFDRLDIDLRHWSQSLGVAIKDSLSSFPRFKKKEEQDSAK